MILFYQILGYLIIATFFFSLISIFANPVVNIFDKNAPTKEDKLFFYLGLISFMLSVGLVFLEQKVAFEHSGIKDSMSIIDTNLNAGKMDLRNLEYNFTRSVLAKNSTVKIKDLEVVSFDESFYQVSVTYSYNVDKWFDHFLDDSQVIYFTYVEKIKKSNP